MASNPEITIITPAYNSGAYLAETLHSAINQTFTNWELIVIDDGSTDNTSLVAQNIAKSDTRIRLIKSPSNQGVAQARNEGLKVARGQYLAFLDSDDMWLPQKLATQLQFMKSSKCSFSYTGYKVMNSASQIIGSKPCESPKVDYNGLISKNIIGCLTVMVHRSLMDSLVFKKQGHEDYILWLALIKKVGFAKGLDENLSIYRVHRNSVSANKFRSVFWTWTVLRQEGLSIIKASLNIFLRAVVRIQPVH